MLNAVIKDTIAIDTKMYVNCNEDVMSYFFNEFGMDIKKNETVSINSHKLISIDSSFEELFIPNENSLGYDGTIYLFADEKCYSSALSFTSTAKRIPQITTLGIATGWFGGRGISPIQRQLPNSGIRFTLEPVVDLSNGIEDLYLNSIDIPIDVDLNYYYCLYGKEEIYTYDFMIRNDPFFKKILEIGE